jgi:glycosyltransferase involved in cell wall biosynthesis
MSAPLVSIILPCYNAHAHLGQALESVRAQTHPNLEILIVNDGSTEQETLEFLDALDDDIRIVHQDNGGLAAARNRAFRETHGEFILPLDCDDWLEPEAITLLLEAQQAALFPAFAFPQIILEGEAEGTLTKNYNHFEQLFANQLPYCLLLSRAAWEEAGDYDESMRPMGYEDWELNIRLGLKGWRGVTVAKPLFHYRVAQDGMLLSVSCKYHCTLWRGIRQKHAPVFRLSMLWSEWRKWSQQPSTYPLGFFFLWLMVAKILPDTWASAMFNRMRRHSHSQRVTRATREMNS